MVEREKKTPGQTVSPKDSGERVSAAGTPKKRPDELPITGNDNNPDLRLSCQYSRHRRRLGPFTLRRSFPYLWRDSANDYDEL